MKYITILEDVEHYNVKKGDMFDVGKDLLITPSIAGALIHAGKAELGKYTITVRSNPKKKAVKTRKKDAPLNVESDSDIH